MSIRDDFFANQAVAALWDVAVSIKRGNPLPLDSNSVFKSYADLETYASGVLAYPGQVVAVVEENSTHIYYLNQNLGIQEVGGVPAVDNASIELNNNILSLHDFEKNFYKFIEKYVDSETNETIESHFEKVSVSEENPWSAGLEPKVVLENGKYVIGWFEPNPNTVEGLQDIVNQVQIDLNTLENIISDDDGLLKRVEVIENAIEEKADANNVYTKIETDSLIANAAHLKRKIYNTVAEAQQFVNENLNEAEHYIFMIPTGLQLDSNRYYEYMAVNGVLEQVGNWEVNLDDYFTEEELKNYLNNYYTEVEVNLILGDYAKKSDLEGYYTSAQVDELLNKHFTKEEITTLLNNYVVKEVGKSLVSDSEIIKLATIQANAQPNYINSVTSNFKVSNTGELSLASISSSQIEDLQTLLDNKVDKVTSIYEGKETPWILLSPENQAKLDSLILGETSVEFIGEVKAGNVKELDTWITTNRDNIPGLFSTTHSQKLSSIEEGAQVNFIKSVDLNQFDVDDNGHLTLMVTPTVDLPFTNVSNDFIINENKTLLLAKNYVENSLYRSEVGNLSDLQYRSKENSTLVDEINLINEKLQWQELI